MEIRTYENTKWSDLTISLTRSKDVNMTQYQALDSRTGLWNHRKGAGEFLSKQEIKFNIDEDTFIKHLRKN